ELRQNVSWLCPDGEPNADLAGPLGDRDQHDVHDADAADDQRDRRDAAEQDRHGLTDLLYLGDDVVVVEDREIVHLPWPQLVALAQNLRELLGRCAHMSVVNDLDDDLVDRSPTKQPDLAGLQWDENNIVLVVPKAAALAGQNSDDREGHVPDADHLSQG